MATVNKDFKIKQGLVVEGATATVNGNQVLTENASDQYILDLIGGETLVKSVSSELSVDGSGQLSIDRNVTDDWYDASGEAATAELNAKNYADGLASNYDPAGSAFDAQQNAEGYTDAQLTNYTTTANLDTTIDGYGYLKSADLTGYATESYVDQAETDAKAYADSLINDASNLSTEVWSAYKTNTEIGLAQSAAESYADTAIANLVDSAPATLDTLNELAAALQDNPDIITDLQDIAAGKQDTLTAGSNIDITGATISVTGLDSADISDFASAALTATSQAYDAAGAASTAQQNAESYTDTGIFNALETAAGYATTAENNANSYTDTEIGNLTTVDIPEGTPGGGLYFTDARAITAIDSAITGGTQTNISVSYNPTTSKFDFVAENGVADSTTDDLAEGEENLYFTDARAIDAVSAADIYPNAVIINNLTKQVANQTTVATAGIATGISWAKESYRSAEFVVKVAYGDHTEISKVLMTLDVNDNISITEYGNVTTNGSASTISADISGTDARLRVTTVNNNSTVTVLGTLIA